AAARRARIGSAWSRCANGPTCTVYRVVPGSGAAAGVGAGSSTRSADAGTVWSGAAGAARVACASSFSEGGAALVVSDLMLKGLLRSGLGLEAGGGDVRGAVSS